MRADWRSHKLDCAVYVQDLELNDVAPGSRGLCYAKFFRHNLQVRTHTLLMVLLWYSRAL